MNKRLERLNNMQYLLTEEEYKALKEQDTKQIETKIQERIEKFRTAFIKLLGDNSELFENRYTLVRANTFCRNAGELIKNI